MHQFCFDQRANMSVSISNINSDSEVAQKLVQWTKQAYSKYPDNHQGIQCYVQSAYNARYPDKPATSTKRDLSVKLPKMSNKRNSRFGVFGGSSFSVSTESLDQPNKIEVVINIYDIEFVVTIKAA